MVTREDRLAAERAIERSRELLFSILSESELERFRALGNIYVKGGVTGTEYQIAPGYSQNIWATTLRAYKNCDCSECMSPRKRNFCYHMQIGAPYWDHMVAQVLYIKYNEEAFLEGAYISG